MSDFRKSFTSVYKINLLFQGYIITTSKYHIFFTSIVISIGLNDFVILQKIKHIFPLH